MNGDYIKVCRSLLKWEWYSNSNTMRLFIHCLLNANWKDGRFEGLDVPRGSFVTSVAKLSEELKLSPKQIRVAMEHLQNTGEVAIKTTNKYTVITVNNYSQYQDDGNQRANKGQTKGKQRATIEEYKEREEGKNIDYSLNNNNAKSVRKFVPPTIEEVRAYCDEKGYRIDPERFVDYYTSNGWMVGRNKMKDWKATVRNWSKQDSPQRKKGGDDGFKLFE